MVGAGIVLSEIETIPSSLGDEQKPKNVIKIKPPIIFSIDDSKRLIMLLDKVMAEDYMQMN